MEWYLRMFSPTLLCVESLEITLQTDELSQLHAKILQYTSLIENFQVTDTTSRIFVVEYRRFKVKGIRQKIYS